jgi:hypothetical protein
MYRKTDAFNFARFVAIRAGAWIITGGTKTGVMEIVGEAAREHMLQNGLVEQNIVLLGIVAWGTVANKEALVVSTKCDYHGPNGPQETFQWVPIGGLGLVGPSANV